MSVVNVMFSPNPLSLHLHQHSHAPPPPLPARPAHPVSSIEFRTGLIINIDGFDSFLGFDGRFTMGFHGSPVKTNRFLLVACGGTPHQEFRVRGCLWMDIQPQMRATPWAGVLGTRSQVVDVPVFNLLHRPFVNLCNPCFGIPFKSLSCTLKQGILYNPRFFRICLEELSNLTWGLATLAILCEDWMEESFPD